MRLSLTKESIFLLLLGTLITYVGYSTWNSYMVSIGVLCIALPFTGLLFLRRLNISLSNTRNEEIFEYETSQNLNLVVRNNGRALRNIQIILPSNKYWNSKQAHLIPLLEKSEDLTYVLKPLTSGLHECLNLKIYKTDPLGFFKQSKSIKVSEKIYAKLPRFPTPDVNTKNLEANVKATTQGNESDDFLFKEWQPGESYDRINWKLSAKTGRKIMKIPEKTSKTLHVTLQGRESTVEQLVCVRRKVENSIKKFEKIVVTLNGQRTVVTYNTMEEFELFLSKNVARNTANNPKGKFRV